MKNKSLFLVLVILCLTSVEIYSSRQELKFDAPLPSNTENGNARSDYGPPGEGDKCWYFDGASSCVNFSFNNCYEDGSPDKPGGLSIQLCKSEKKEFYIRYSS